MEDLEYGCPTCVLIDRYGAEGAIALLHNLAGLIRAGVDPEKVASHMDDIRERLTRELREDEEA